MNKKVVVLSVISILILGVVGCTKAAPEQEVQKIIDCTRRATQEPLDMAGVKDLTLIKPRYGDLQELAERQIPLETLIIYGDIIIAEEKLLTYFQTKVGNLTIEADLLDFKATEQSSSSSNTIKHIKLICDEIKGFEKIKFSETLVSLKIEAPITLDIANYEKLEKLDFLVLRKANLVNLESNSFPKNVTELVIEDATLDGAKALLEMKNIVGMALINTNILDFITAIDLDFVPELFLK